MVIDYDSAPGAWLNAMAYSVNIRISDYNPEEAAMIRNLLDRRAARDIADPHVRGHVIRKINERARRA